MIVHVNVEVVQIVKDGATLDTIDGPQVVLDLMLIFAHLSIVGAAAVAAVVVVHGETVVGRGAGLVGHRRRNGRLECEGGLGEMLQRQLGDCSATALVVVNTWHQDGRHLGLFPL